jgi:hypothetical protein
MSSKVESKIAGEVSESEAKPPSMSECVLKFDHFENIHRLPADCTLVSADAPNFRKVVGFSVFGTGQPTVAAFREIVSYLRDTLDNPRILWTNMRQVSSCEHCCKCL